MKKYLILILLCYQSVFGQKFNFTASLPIIEQSGFYRIPLSVELTSQLNENFSNIRLYDSIREIPYLLNTEKPVFASKEFIEYPILEKTSNNKFTQIVFGNASKKSIDNISIVIKNADANKEATLLGSDDGNSWYALKESFWFSPIQSTNQTFETRIIDFPLSNYSKFKLKINDSLNAPLNILKIGYYETDEELGNYNTLPLPNITLDENQTSKKSILKIVFDTLLLVDKLEFEIKAPTFFNRSAIIRKPATRHSLKKRIKTEDDIIERIRFNSKQQSVFYIAHSTASKELTIEIDNEDNPPLEISTVRAYQLKRDLIAWLEKGKTYLIKVGNSDMRSPSYDIGLSFKDSIATRPPTLKHGDIISIHSSEIKNYNWFEDKRIMWAAIVLVMGILAFMSYKMVKETGRN